MRYARIRKMDISNGLGVGVSLFVQGCHFHCPECFNKETWDFNGGQEYTKKTTETILELLDQPQITRFSILGGEPLEPCNLYPLSIVINAIKKEKPDIKIWLYTGYTYENLLVRKERENINYLTFILNNIDVLVDGQFIQEKKDISYKYAGSTNQRVIDLNKTIDSNIVELGVNQ